MAKKDDNLPCKHCNDSKYITKVSCPVCKGSQEDSEGKPCKRCDATGVFALATVECFYCSGKRR